MYIINPNRIVHINEREHKKGPIVYWMQRDQRVDDNWALIYSMELQKKYNVPIYVVFCLVEEFNNASLRRYSFMLTGLQKIEISLQKYNIPFKLLVGNPAIALPLFLKEIDAGVLVSDFNPLRHITKWKNKINVKIRIPFYEVDAHNIVPCRTASNKLEYAAYTIRPKINNLLDEYLTDFPKLYKIKITPEKINNAWDENSWATTEVKNVSGLKPGGDEALKVLKNFIACKLSLYKDKKNDPTIDGSSNLSPYINFGQISAQRIAFTIKQTGSNKESVNSFLEELIVRRELADNFCLYNKEYDSFEGFHPWAKETLNQHRRDKREFVYTARRLENYRTHDELWNASQKEMMITGKMHGYLRMYWAKKILEWSPSPEEAMDSAIYLNDKYELDGRDPNGYAGIAWSIGGVHDRAWGERKIFGKIRYMNFNGCKRKFDVNLYINNINRIDE